MKLSSVACFIQHNHFWPLKVSYNVPNCATVFSAKNSWHAQLQYCLTKLIQYIKWFITILHSKGFVYKTIRDTLLMIYLRHINLIDFGNFSNRIIYLFLLYKTSSRVTHYWTLIRNMENIPFRPFIFKWTDYVFSEPTPIK